MDIRHIENFGQIIAFSDLSNEAFDLYCYHTHPHDIHDKYGSLAVEEFYNIIISELEKYNTKVYRVSTAVFAIPSAENNPPLLSINFKSKIYNIFKRRVTINNI